MYPSLPCVNIRDAAGHAVQQGGGGHPPRPADEGVERAHRQEHHVVPRASVTPLQLPRGALLLRVPHPTLQGESGLEIHCWFHAQSCRLCFVGYLVGPCILCSLSGALMQMTKASKTLLPDGVFYRGLYRSTSITWTPWWSVVSPGTTPSPSHAWSSFSA